MRQVPIAHLTVLACYMIMMSCSGKTPPDFTPTSSDSISDVDTISDTDPSMGTDSDIYQDTSDTNESSDDPTDSADTGIDTGTDTNPTSVIPWWNCDYRKRREIEITNLNHVDSGHSVEVEFDHEKLVKDKLSQIDGDDIRVLYWDGSSHQELSRVLDPQSSWNKRDTKIWCGIPSSGVDLKGAGKLYIYFSNFSAATPPDDEGDVFHFADYFKRPNSTILGNNWIVYEGAGTDIELRDNAMYFLETANAANRPGADHSMPPLSDRFRFRFGFDWTRTGTENIYRLHMQLGKATAMESTPDTASDHFSNTGVGPSLLWAGPNDGMSDHQALGYETGGSDKVTQVAVVSGPTDVQLDVDVVNKQYDLSVAGANYATEIPFSDNIASIDLVRFFSWELGTWALSTRSFHYVIVQKTSSPLPITNLSNDNSDGDYTATCGEI